MEDKEIFRSMLERDVGNLYDNIRGSLLDMIPNGFKPVIHNYLRANEETWINKLQEYCDMLVETSFIDPNATIEEAMENASITINGAISDFLVDKLEIPENVLHIAVPLLFGTNI